MKAEFWQERWEANQLGFHQNEVNDLLKRHWKALNVPAEKTAFVPLCGKSLDMRWLREQGHPVLGVELSSIACRDFFAEAGTPASLGTTGQFESYAAEGYKLYCGDFFDLTRKDLPEVGGVFDRGSLVALPPELRRRYATHMAEILPDGAQILLLTVDYDQSEMKGPPHSVPYDEVASLFEKSFTLDRLDQKGPSDPPPPFKARGLSSISESICRLERRNRQA